MVSPSHRLGGLGWWGGLFGLKVSLDSGTVRVWFLSCLFLKSCNVLSKILGVCVHVRACVHAMCVCGVCM